MSSVICPSRPRGGLRSRARVDRQLARFPKSFRREVEALARLHPSLADLAVSFPALLFALAAPRFGFTPGPVIQRVIDGARLAETAGLAGVPLWMRRLPPEAFVQPLSRRLPDGPLFRRQISNHLPATPRSAAIWLEKVVNAADWGHEPLAVWIARELVKAPTKAGRRPIRRIALWAWYGTHAHDDLAATVAVPRKVWHPSMTYETAQAEADLWWDRHVSLHLFLAAKPVADTWMRPGTVDGYEFVALTTAADIAAEADAMNNCLRTYGAHVAHNNYRLWSVRQHGQRVATLQINPASGSGWMVVGMLLAASNSTAADDVQWAARRWVDSHDLAQIRSNAIDWTEASALDAATWRAFWRPYWLAKGRIPDWLPLRPSRYALDGV
jgi:hypothetical protein